MTIITLSRQHGSGGDEVAHRVCDLLGYSYFDKQMLTGVAIEAGLSSDETTDFSIDNYRTHNFFDRMLVGWRAPHTIAQSETWQEELLKSSETPDSVEQNATLVEKTLHLAYNEDDIVIVGRGGQACLKNRPNVIHVRIVAPLEDRINRVQTRQDLDFSTAKNLIQKRDRASAAYLKRFYNVDWTNPLLYHLIINTGFLTIDAAAQLVVTAVKSLSSPDS